MLKIIFSLCALLPSYLIAGVFVKAKIEVASVAMSENQDGVNSCGLLINAVGSSEGVNFAGFNGSINLDRKGVALIKGRHSDIKVMLKNNSEPDINFVTIPSGHVWFKTDGGERTRPVGHVMSSPEDYKIYISDFDVASEIISGIFSNKVLNIGVTRKKDDLEVIYYGQPEVGDDIVERFAVCIYGLGN